LLSPIGLLTASFLILFHGRDARLRTPSVLFSVALANRSAPYTGIVWKDVLMAHLVAFGYVCLCTAATRPAYPGRQILVFVALAALALGASLRQHALIFSIPGAVYAACLLSRRWQWRLGLTAVLSAAVIAATSPSSATRTPSR
jgi:hypothetical protein